MPGMSVAGVRVRRWLISAATVCGMAWITISGVCAMAAAVPVAAVASPVGTAGVSRPSAARLLPALHVPASTTSPRGRSVATGAGQTEWGAAAVDGAGTASDSDGTTGTAIDAAAGGGVSGVSGTAVDSADLSAGSGRETPGWLPWLVLPLLVLVIVGATRAYQRSPQGEATRRRRQARASVRSSRWSRAGRHVLASGWSRAYGHGPVPVRRESDRRPEATGNASDATASGSIKLQTGVPEVIDPFPGGVPTATPVAGVALLGWEPPSHDR
jgi:hypothetical protein